MKKLCLAFTIIFSVSAFGQTRDSSYSWFIKNELLSDSQLSAYKYVVVSFRETFLESLKEIKNQQQRDERKKQILAASDLEILSPFFSSTNGNDTLKRLMYFHLAGLKKNFSTQGIYFAGDTTINENNVSGEYLSGLKNFLNKLRTLGFVPQKSFKILDGEIEQKKILDSFYVVKRLMEENQLRDYYSVKSLDPFLSKLVRLKLVSNENYGLLKSLAEKEEIEDISIILEKCNKAIVVNLNEYGDFPEQYEEPVHKKISTLTPELSFTDFKVEVTKEKSSYDTSYDFHTICSFINDGKKYSHKNFYSPADYNKDGHPDNEWKMGDDLYAIFNKVLKDKQSKYRLHTLPFHGDYITRASGVTGFILLEKWQADSLRSGTYFDLSYENFDNGLTTEKIKEAVNIYKQIGLFASLSQVEYDSCNKALQSTSVNYYSDILRCFKNVIFEADLEWGVDDYQYKKITKYIAGISRGKFNPTNIVDTYKWENRKSFKYGFTLGNKKYLVNLKQPDDWLDTKFWELIVKAVSEQNTDGKFYEIYPSDGLKIIYLSKQQYKILSEQNLLEFTMPLPE